MQGLAAHGKDIGTVIQPTFQAFVPLLQANAATIRSTPRSTHAYGPRPRQMLDLYLPATSVSKPPVIFFLYGGGFVSGGKDHPAAPGLVYANVGAYFAQRGFITCVVDYRLVPLAMGAAEGAAGDLSGGENAGKYPSGPEDLAEAMKWATTSLPKLRKGADTTRLYAIGNSAGGVHVITYVLDPKFQLASSMPKLNKAVSLGAPFDFNNTLADRIPVLEAYYGSAEAIKTHAPAGLLASLSKDEVAQLPPILAMDSPLDPDEVRVPHAMFAKACREKGVNAKFEETLEEHNHISVALALCSGEGERFGEQIVDFLNEV